MGLTRRAVYTDSRRHSKLALPVQLGDMLLLTDSTLIVTDMRGPTGRVLVCLRDDGEMISLGRSLFYDDPYDKPAWFR